MAGIGGVLTPNLCQMCSDMVARGVTEAAMESTAVYWVPVWNELCESMILVAVWHMLSKEQDFIDLYLKRLEEQKLMEEKTRQLESKMA